MYEILATDEFTKRFRALPKGIQRKLEKQRRIFASNPFHPSLHTEKLQPKKREYWSFRIDRSYRVIFRFNTRNQVLLITVGTHDWVYRMK